MDLRYDRNEDARAPGGAAADATAIAGAAERQALVRHELRTPLAVMRPLLDMLLDGTAGELDEKLAGHLRMLERNVDRLAAMITSLVESGWLEIAALPQDRVAVAVDGLVRAAVADARSSDAESPRLVVRVPGGLPPLYGDPHRLRRALRNVIVNACAMTPSTGDVRVSARLSDRDGWILLRVDDTGLGVPSDETGRVFDFGFQGSDARGRAERGLGLGLFVAREIIEEHGGRIALESAPGEGTRVSVELPCSAPRAAGRAG